MTLDKPSLRDRFRSLRAAIPESERARAAVAATERLLALQVIAGARTLLVCLSFGDELSTRRLVAELTAAGRRVAAPRAVPGSRELTVHPLPCAMETLGFGLRQPAADAPAIDPETIDVVVIAGLAFDHRGTRLGYGAGYFDRFLAGRTFPKIGWCFDAQLVDELPREPHDVAMDRVQTERRTVRP